MAQATSQGNSTRVLHSDDSQCSKPNLITVKDAARRLGVSKSTVYRFDRDNGPLRFVVDGRPILIENDSFETYLANIHRPETEPGSPEDEGLCDCPQEEQPDRTTPIMGEKPLEASTDTPPCDVPRPISSSGQRDHIVPRSYAPGLLYYTGWMG